MADVFEIVGSVLIDSPGCGTQPRLPLPIAVKQIASQTIVAPTRTINTPSTWIDLLEANGFSTVTGLAVIVSSGAIEVRWTSGLAADQVSPVTDFLAWASKTVGSELTALAVRGVGTYKMIIAGGA